jgi:O-antigen/teichoic acid export membrane protein
MDAARLRTLVASTGWLLAAQTVAGLCQFLTIALIARHLGPVAFGGWAFAYALVNFFAAAADLGLATTAVRDLSRAPKLAPRYLGAAALIKAPSGVILLATMTVSGLALAGDGDSAVLVFLLGAQLILASAILFLLSILRAYGDARFELATRFLQAVLTLAVVIVLTAGDANVREIAAGYLASTAVAFAGIALFASRRYGFSLQIERALIRRLLTDSLPIAGAMMLSTVYFYFDSIYMGSLGQHEAVGWYSAAYAPVLWVLGVVLVVRAAFMPEQARQFNGANDPSAFLSTYGRISLALGLPVAFGGVLVAGDFIEMVYGESYAGATFAMQLLSVAAGLMFVSNFYVSTLIVQGRQRTCLAGAALAAAINVGLNLWLIPRYSLDAAAATTLAAEVVVAAFALWQCRGVVDLGAMLRYGRVPLLACGPLAAVTLVTIDFLPLPLSILAGAATYAASAYSLGFLRQLQLPPFENRIADAA